MSKALKIHRYDPQAEQRHLDPIKIEQCRRVIFGREDEKEEDIDNENMDTVSEDGESELMRIKKAEEEDEYM